jgi:hypothetical protein
MSKQLEKVEYFHNFDNMINDAGGILEIKSRIAKAKAAFNIKKQNLFTSNLELKLRKKLVICSTWSVALYGAKTYDTSERRSEIAGKF